MKTPFVKAALAIAWKDLRAELRSRQLISAMALFALLSTMVFYFTLASRPDIRIGALPAVLWATVVFAGTLGLNRSLAGEQDRGGFDGLLARADRSVGAVIRQTDRDVVVLSGRGKPRVYCLEYPV